MEDDKLRLLRYFAIIPVCILAWITVLFAGVYFQALLVFTVCPVEFLEGSDCYVSWWRTVELSLMAVFSGVSAAVAIATGSVIAPDNRYRVAVYIYRTGSILATLIVIVGWYFWPAWLSALLVGALTLRIVKRLI